MKKLIYITQGFKLRLTFYYLIVITKTLLTSLWGLVIGSVIKNVEQTGDVGMVLPLWFLGFILSSIVGEWCLIHLNVDVNCSLMKHTIKNGWSTKQPVEEIGATSRYSKKLTITLMYDIPDIVRLIVSTVSLLYVLYTVNLTSFVIGFIALFISIIVSYLLKEKVSNNLMIDKKLKLDEQLVINTKDHNILDNWLKNTTENNYGIGRLDILQNIIQSPIVYGSLAICLVLTNLNVSNVVVLISTFFNLDGQVSQFSVVQVSIKQTKLAIEDFTIKQVN